MLVGRGSMAAGHSTGFRPLSRPLPKKEEEKWKQKEVQRRQEEEDCKKQSSDLAFR